MTVRSAAESGARLDRHFSFHYSAEKQIGLDDEGRIGLGLGIGIRFSCPHPSPSSLRILGIDPGLGNIGIGVVDAASVHRIRPVEWLMLRTSPGLPLAKRLLEIQRDLTAILREFRPDLAVVEKLFFARNERTVMEVAQARGTILCTIASQGIPLLEPTPLQLKCAIAGSGSAEKGQIRRMLTIMLNLREPPRPDDAADALALAVYGALQKELGVRT